MIDIAQLKRAAKSGDGESTVVTRRFLQQALDEIVAGRQARADLAQHMGTDAVIGRITRR